MKIKLYNIALDSTSVLLNICIYFGKWSFVKNLIKFRKEFIVKNLREITPKVKLQSMQEV